MSMTLRRAAMIVAATMTLGACSSVFPGEVSPAPKAAEDYSASSDIHPALWRKGRGGIDRDAKIEAEVAALLAQMTLEEKVGQVIQADISTVTPADVRTYHLGSILDGGNSGPYGNDRAPAQDWLKAADEFYAAAMDVAPGRPAIPLIWGSDAVHGNSNIFGATIFPHNIGLGAADDSELLRRIGEITALELRVVGDDWTFAPTITVVRDDRWGRSYEGYSEDPAIVSAYAGAIIEGIQGKPGDADFLKGPHVIATAKHFLGDGGTDAGHDQGDNLYSETALRDIFAPPYEAAIKAGVQTVMVSYSSWRGHKMTGTRTLLSDVLVDRLGFDGFVVDDWNAFSQLPGCTREDCADALKAGMDMYMAPDGWKGLYTNTLAEARSGAIPMTRLDEAVSRVLRVKLRAGLMEESKPSARPFAGQWGQLGSPEHRAVARQAVRESLVLLKNEDGVLPLSPRAHVLVAGDGADNLPKQCGGWTISWQGDGNSRSDFPHGATIFEGIRDAVQGAGGTATLSADGTFSDKPDAAIVVFGENPYAEFQGDRPDVDYESGNKRDLELLQRLRAQGIPVVSVFLSGRPLYATPEINASNAFVAAWLPGSEGAGVADILFRKADGSVAYDFRGKLSFSWPRAPDQTPLNVGVEPYNPLFAYGYGLTYAGPRDLGVLPEAKEIAVGTANLGSYLDAGRTVPPWLLAPVATSALRVAHADRAKQEDVLVASWNGRGRASLAVTGAPINLARQTNGDMALVLEVKVDKAPGGPVNLSMGCGDQCRGSVDLTAALTAAAGSGWTSVAVRLSCLRTAGANMATISTPFELSTAGGFAVSLSSVKLAPGVGPPTCPAPPPAS